MAGRNQHHIPQFLQRGFAVVGSDEHQIWRFDRERLPTRPRSIRSTASEDWFYSDDPVDGSRTLDDEITDEERPIFALLSSVRSLGTGAFIDASEAATLVIRQLSTFSIEEGLGPSRHPPSIRTSGRA